MEKKAVHLDDHLTLDQKINSTTNASTKFLADADTDIQAKGTAMGAAATAATAAKSARASLQTQLDTAVATEHQAETDLEAAYNLGVDKANEVYPHDAVKLGGLGLDLSKDATYVVPGKVEGCSAVRDDDPTKVDIHYHSVKAARVYFVMETTDADNLMNPASYYPANPQTFLNGKGGEVTPKTPTLPTWWRIYAENPNGKGDWSDPFGGFKLS